MLLCPIRRLEFSDCLEVKILIRKEEIREQEKRKGRRKHEDGN